MAYTPNPEWQDGVDGGTLITADALNNIEDGLVAIYDEVGGKADVEHTHTPASIGAAPASHTHGAADLSGVVKTVNGTGPDGAGNVDVAVAGGGGAPVQHIPPVGQEFTSSFFISGTTAHLRSGTATVMPLYVPETIQVDKVSINVVTPASAGILGRITYSELAGNTWQTIATLADNIDLDVAGIKEFVISPISLTAGKVYGFHVFQTNGGDFAVRLRSGGITGPGTQGAIATSTWSVLPIALGMNGGLSQFVPIVKVRRSA